MGGVPRNKRDRAPTGCAPPASVPPVSRLRQPVTRRAAPEAARRARAASTPAQGARGRDARPRSQPRPTPLGAHQAVNQGRDRWTNGIVTRKSACQDQPMKRGVKSSPVRARPMRDSGLTINLSAGDSERERVCCERAGGAVGGGAKQGYSGGRGRGQAKDCSLLERRPNGEGQRQASTGRGLPRVTDKDSGGCTGTDFPSKHSRPTRAYPRKPRFPFSFFQLSLY